jgi:dehydratase family protein
VAAFASQAAIKTMLEIMSVGRERSDHDANVESGDLIRLDVPGRSIDLLIDATELARRASPWKLRERPEWAERGYPCLFYDTVSQADEGRDFDFMMGTKR